MQQSVIIFLTALTQEEYVYGTKITRYRNYKDRRLPQKMKTTDNVVACYDINCEPSNLSETLYLLIIE